MKKMLKEYERRIQFAKKELDSMNPDSYEYITSKIQIDNMSFVQGFLPYLYKYALLMTDIKEYRKQNNIPAEMTDEEVKTNFANFYYEQECLYNRVAYPKVDENDLAIFRLMRTKSGYLVLEESQDRIRKMLKEHSSLTYTFDPDEFHYDVPIEGTSITKKMTLEELQSLQERIEKTLEKLYSLTKILNNYSPIYEDLFFSRETVLNEIFNVRDIHLGSDYYGKFNYYRDKFNSLRNQHHRRVLLRLIPTIRRKEKAKYKLEISTIYNKVYEFFIAAIDGKRRDLLSFIDDDELKDLGAFFQILRLKDYIKCLEARLSSIEDAIDYLKYEQIELENSINEELDKVRDHSKIPLHNPEAYAQKDLFEVYAKEDLRSKAKGIDILVMKEITETYGTIGRGYAFRIVKETTEE